MNSNHPNLFRYKDDFDTMALDGMALFVEMLETANLEEFGVITLSTLSKNLMSMIRRCRKILDEGEMTPEFEDTAYTIIERCFSVLEKIQMDFRAGLEITDMLPNERSAILAFLADYIKITIDEQKFRTPRNYEDNLILDGVNVSAILDTFDPFTDCIQQ